MHAAEALRLQHVDVQDGYQCQTYVAIWLVPDTLDCYHERPAGVSF